MAEGALSVTPPGGRGSYQEELISALAQHGPGFNPAWSQPGSQDTESHRETREDRGS